MLLAPAFSINALPDVPLGEAYNVTVASGTVASDLTDFPLMVDLSHMPASFWSAIRSDGGNLRAYESDGSTPLAMDLTYIDTVREVGRMFVKTTLLSASDNVIQLKVLDAANTTPTVGDTYGRNAVWQDFEVVWVFPETDNRVGGSLVQDLSGLEPHTPWIRQAFTALSGAPHQGIATDGAGTFVSIDTDYLRKYTSTDFGTIVAPNGTPIADTGIALVDHLGDGCIIGSEIFMPLEECPNTPYDNQHIVVFNLSDLSFNRSYDISAQGHEARSICYDGTNLWVTDYITLNEIHRYTTAGVFIETVTLSSDIVQMQGVEYIDGKLYISTTLGNVYEVETDGTVNGVVYVDPHDNIGEGLTYDGTRLYLMKGDGDLITLERDKHSDYVKGHGDFGTVTLPRLATWTASTSLFTTVADVQDAYMGLGNGPDFNNSEALLYGDGPDQFDVWNSSDSWMDPPTSVNPGAYEDHRIVFAHDGSTRRKIVVNGVLGEEETSGVSVRPTGSGTDMEFNLNGSRVDGAETGEAYYQYTWLRDEYMSDDWLAADAANMNSPETFYEIVGTGLYDGKVVMFMPAGQSNSVGRGGPIDPVLDATDADILEYDADGDSYAVAEDPIDHFNENPDQIGFVMTFAKDFKAANPGLDKVLIVGCGLGGAGFIVGTWNAGGDGSQYEDAKTRWNAAYARAVATYGAENVVVGGVLWVQGEDEAIDYPSLFSSGDGNLQYATMPQSMLTGMRKSWDGLSDDTPIVVAEVPEGTALNATAVAEINAGILALPSTLPYSASINQDGTTFGDDRHWDAASLRTMGSRFALALPDALTNDSVGGVPAFATDASNVETAFAFSAVGMPNGGLVFPSEGVAAWDEFDNKRVYIAGGKFIFDGTAELRLRRSGKPQLADRDFLLKFVFQTDAAGQQGIIADYDTSTNQRAFVCRYNSGDLQFYMSDTGTSATLMLSHPLSTGTEYEIEIRRVGTAMTLHVDGVEEDTYTLSSGYDVFTTPDTQALLIGEFTNNVELEGHIESISLEFLSA